MQNKTPTRLVVLVSNKGSGTNLQSIIDAIELEQLNCQIICVISDTPDAYGLVRAREHNIETQISPKKEHLLRVVNSYNPDYICLAGWKQFIPDEFISAYPNKILNLHPGLIPDTMDGIIKCPDGSKGLWSKGKLTDKAIACFIQEKATYAGSSIHFLTHEFDFGPVLGRCFEKVEPNDTTQSLYARLKKKENELYVSVLQDLSK